jgi:hypothetical protein
LGDLTEAAGSRTRARPDLILFRRVIIKLDLMRTLLCFVVMLAASGYLFFFAQHHAQARRESPHTLASVYDRFFADLDAKPVGYLPPLFLFGALGMFGALYPAFLILLASSRAGRGWLIAAGLLAGAGALVNLTGIVLARLKMGLTGPHATVFFWLIPLLQLTVGAISIAIASSGRLAAIWNGWLPPLTGWALLVSRGMLLAICAGLLAVPAKRLLEKPPTDAERLDRFEEKIKAKGSVFRIELGGKPVAFLLMDCTVYLLTVANKEVVQDKVLGAGFYPWFTVCQHSTLEQDGEFVKVYLAKQAVGAGGGSVAGGNFRSKDGRSWEKKMDEGWSSTGW